MVRLVLFDIDGTLVRTGGAGVRAFDQAGAVAFGVIHGARRFRFAGRTDTSLVREFLVTHRIPPHPENFDRFLAAYIFLLDRYLPEHAGHPCRGVEELIRGMSALPRPPLLGLQTGNIRLGAELKLRHLGLWEPFATGGFGDDAEDRNQLAAIARERGGRLAGRPLAGEEILVIGDTPHDIACGRSIGARVLAVATGGNSIEELRACEPDWCVPDLGGVTADQVCG